MWKWKARKLRSEVCLVAGTLKVQRKCYVSFRNIKTCLDGAFLLCIVCPVESHEYLSCAWQTCASTFQSVVSILSFFSHCYKIPSGVPNTICSGDASLFILALPLITVNFWVYIKKFYFGYIWFDFEMAVSKLSKSCISSIRWFIFTSDFTFGGISFSFVLVFYLYWPIILISAFYKMPLGLFTWQKGGNIITCGYLIWTE